MSISGFHGQYRFLSNFWSCPLTLSGLTFPTAEHAYQAAKSTDPQDWKDVLECVSPGAAKRMGKIITLRTDWEQIKVHVMAQIIHAKFQNNDLRQLLLQTGEQRLIEENTWNDTFWGVCNGKGINMLGNLLMIERDLIVKQ